MNFGKTYLFCPLILSSGQYTCNLANWKFHYPAGQPEGRKAAHSCSLSSVTEEGQDKLRTSSRLEQWKDPLLNGQIVLTLLFLPFASSFSNTFWLSFSCIYFYSHSIFLLLCCLLNLLPCSSFNIFALLASPCSVIPYLPLWLTTFFLFIFQ